MHSSFSEIRGFPQTAQRCSSPEKTSRNLFRQSEQRPESAEKTSGFPQQAQPCGKTISASRPAAVEKRWVFIPLKGYENPRRFNVRKNFLSGVFYRGISF
jgi:hypothetical protein